MDGGELFSRIEESQGFSERGENYKYYEYFDCDGEYFEELKGLSETGDNSTNIFQLKHKYLLCYLMTLESIPIS